MNRVFLQAKYFRHQVLIFEKEPAEVICKFCILSRQAEDYLRSVLHNQLNDWQM